MKIQVLVERVFNAGEEIEGQLQLSLKKQRTIRELTVEIEGKESVEFTFEWGTGRKATSPMFLGVLPTRIFRDTVNIVSARTILETNKELPPGNHIFPFQFKLPNDALPSYVGNDVLITYRINAQAIISRLRNPKVQLPIVVLSQELGNPQQSKKTFTLQEDSNLEVTLQEDLLQVGSTGRIFLELTDQLEFLDRIQLKLLGTEHVAVSSVSTSEDVYEVPIHTINQEQLQQASSFDINFSIPKNLFPSFQGNVSRLDYEIEITAIFGRRKKKKYRLPVRILEKERSNQKLKIND